MKKKPGHGYHNTENAPMKSVVFCDFDGTITCEDGFVNVCTHFAGDMVTKYLPDIMSKKISLKDGICKIIESIPSKQYPEMLEFVRGATLRKGFSEFISFLKAEDVPLIIISGGLKELVEVQLDVHRHQIQEIFAAGLVKDKEFLSIISDFSTHDQLIEKTKVMDRFNYQESIAIGDGLTDQSMSLASDVVFARKGLGDFLRIEKKAFQEWHDFHDIIGSLKKHWKLS